MAAPGDAKGRGGEGNHSTQRPGQGPGEMASARTDLSVSPCQKGSSNHPWPGQPL